MKGVKTEIYEVIIIGGGPGGLTAGLYTSRARLSTLLIESALFGGQMTTTELIENYPGFPQGVTGDELSRLMEDQAKKFGMKTVTQEVVKVSLEGDMKVVQTYESAYRCEALIVSTGSGISEIRRSRGEGVRRERRLLLCHLRWSLFSG